MILPTEAEIRSFAEKTGAIDGDGNYTVSRSKLAAGAQRYRDELAQEANDSPDPATVVVLKRLHADLLSEFDPGVAHELLISMSPALVRRQGLQLKERKVTPHE